MVSKKSKKAFKQSRKTRVRLNEYMKRMHYGVERKEEKVVRKIQNRIFKEGKKEIKYVETENSNLKYGNFLDRLINSKSLDIY